MTSSLHVNYVLVLHVDLEVLLKNCLDLFLTMNDNEEAGNPLNHPKSTLFLDKRERKSYLCNQKESIFIN